MIVFRGHWMQRRVAKSHHHRSADCGPGFGAVAGKHRQRIATLEADQSKQRNKARDGVAKLAIAPADLPIRERRTITKPCDRIDDKTAGRSARMKLLQDALPDMLLCVVSRARYGGRSCAASQANTR